jgi:hypothetical protein
MSRWAWMSCSLLAAGFGAGLPPAQADAAGPRIEASAFGSYRVGGEFDVEVSPGLTRSVDLADGSGWGAGLALYRDPESFYEFLYSRQSTGLTRADTPLGGADITTEYFHLGGTLLFERQPWMLPYVSLTAGITRFKAGGFSAESKFSASLGGGLRLQLNDRVALALGLRGYLTFVDTDSGLLCSSADGEGVCLFQGAGSSVFQGEATAGFVVGF